VIRVVIADDQAFYIGSQNLYPANLAELGYIVDDATAYIVPLAALVIALEAVRRRLAHRAASEPYAAWLGEAVYGLGEAQFLQFQEQLADEPTLVNAAATLKLAWLPPAGFLPATAPWQTFLGARAPAKLVSLASADAPEVLAAALRGDAAFHSLIAEH